MAYAVVVTRPNSSVRKSEIYGFEKLEDAQAYFIYLFSSEHKKAEEGKLENDYECFAKVCDDPKYGKITIRRCEDSKEFVTEFYLNGIYE